MRHTSMKHTSMTHTSVTHTITHTIQEPTTKQDPFYLQSLLYDLPIDETTLTQLTIQITIPKNIAAHIIDDLKFTNISSNTIEFVLHEASQLTYQLFVANHQLCDACERKELYDCQSLPDIFEKNVTVTLAEPHAQAYLKCHYLGDKKSELHLSTTQRHQADHTTSKLVVKSVLDNETKLVSKNEIDVPKGLTGVIAEQTNKNLMLNPNARVISIPRLKVDSKHAACKHGATVSSIDPEKLFYLQSRSIGKIDAERMLIEAFLR